MPQDSLRSVVFRSFVTCDDPKGVAECRTIRKSKTDSQKLEGKVETTKQPKNLNKSSSCKEGKQKMASKAATEELLHSKPSSLQLMEVSRGAQKLNKVIDSWSKGASFDVQYKGIARDLLKGALDLQESLAMLGKLQEASQQMSRLKKKQKERVDEMGIERSHSARFGYPIQEMGFQKPRLSADGSSRDCYEELREVIRDSLARQNLLPSSSSDEKSYFGRRNLDSSPDMPTTSSSRSSSMGYSREFGSSDSSFSSKLPEEKPKGSNLIAKLMGLEETRSKPLQSAPQKQLERENILNQRRPISEIDMPKGRKPQFNAGKLDKGRMTLDEIVEIMQFKGILNGNKHQNYPSNTSYMGKRFNDDSPPIVIMKPLRSGREAEEGGLETEEMPRKWKIKEEVPSRVMDRQGGALSSNEMHRKLEVEETPFKKLQGDIGGKDCKEVLAKPEDKKVKIKERVSSSKIKAFVPLSPKPQKKELIEKKVDKIQKMAPSRRKPVEMDNVKSTTDSKMHQQGNVTKPESGSKTVRSRIPQPKVTTSNPISKRPKPAISHSHNATDRKKGAKNEKPVSDPLATKVEKGAGNDEDLLIVICKSESDTITTRSSSAMQFLLEEEMDATDNLIKDNCNNDQNFLGEATPVTTQLESTNRTPEEASNPVGQDVTEAILSEPSTSTQDLSSSCPPFLNHAEELFNKNAYQPVFLETTLHDCETPKLLLDCANELMEYRNQHIPTVHPLLQNSLRKSSFPMSTYQLMRNVHDGIENLRNYTKLAGQALVADAVHSVLKRDMWFKGVAGGGWGKGWRDGFTVGEVEQVAEDIDKLLLTDLISEVLSDFRL